MRIAVVSEGYFPEVSGVTVAVAQHLRYLAARGHEVLLVHPRYPEDVLARMGSVSLPDGDARRFRFESVAIAPDREETRIPSTVGAAQLDEEMTRFRPEVVTYHNPDRLVPELSKVWKRSRVAGVEGARRRGAIVVPIIHTLLPLFIERSGSFVWRIPPVAAITRRLWSDIYNRNFDFAVTVDTAAREYLQAIGVRIPMLAGSYNGVDTGVFRVRPATPSPDPERPLRIVWIGRLVHEKNAALLPHLARGLDELGVRFELNILGDGPLRPVLEREPRMARGVSLRGWMPPEQVAAELARSDLYLSVSDTESYSLTASEALASGVPVIAPNVIGFRRLAAMNVGALFSASHLTPAGMREVARLIQASRPRLDEWARRAAAEAPKLSWGAALDRLYGDLGERTRLPFVS